MLRDALFSSSYLKVRKDVQKGGSTLLHHLRSFQFACPALPILDSSREFFV